MGIARDTSMFASSLFANSLFVYGTLRDDDVLRIVLGYDLPAHRRRRAVLNDFDRRMLHDESYPVLVGAPGACVPGCVLMLDEADMRRISFFEANEYTFERASSAVARHDHSPTFAPTSKTTNGSKAARFQLRMPD